MKLRANKRTVIPAVHANRGVEAAYYDKLASLIDQMHTSVTYWIKAQYRANTPRLAQDASPGADLNKVMLRTGSRWQRKFDKASKDIATSFVDKSTGSADAVFKGHLKKAGFTVAFQNSHVHNDAYRAKIAENVGLIRSIPKQYLDQVHQRVMDSVQHGRDLATLSKELETRYNVTKSRAALIARDQNNKATSLAIRLRQKHLGIKKGRWLHSGGGEHPRESHEDADGEEFDVEQGCLIDGEYIFCGELVGCRCVSESVIPGFEDDDD